MSVFSEKIEQFSERMLSREDPVSVRVPWWLRIVFAVAGGTCVFLSFPDYNMFYLAWIAMALELWAIEGLGARKAFLVAMLAGIVTNIGGFSWLETTIEVFGMFPAWISWILCIAVCCVQALVFGIWGLLVAALRRTRFPHLLPVAAFVTMEFLWPMIFPWFLANSQHNFLPALQIADIFGVLGVSALVMCVNLVIFDLTRTLWLRHRKQPVRFSRAFYGVAGGYIVACMVYAPIRMAWVDREQAEAQKVRIGMVEADVGIWMIESREKVKASLYTHHRLSKELEEQGAELIVWPESGYQSTYIWGSSLRDASPTDREIDALFSPWFQPRARSIYGVLDTAFGEDFRETLPAHEALQRGISAATQRLGYVPMDIYYVAYTRGFAAPCRPEKPYVHRCPHISVTPDDIAWYYTSPVPLKGSLDDDFRFHTAPYDIASPNRDLSAALLFGTLTVDYGNDEQADVKEIYRGMTDRRVFNTAKLIEPDGTVIGSYHKKYLMPFGEYMPFGDLFPQIYDLVPSAGRLTRGDDVGTMEFRGFRLGPIICYEDILPRYVNQLSRLIPHVFVNITDDAWFGKTSEPWQHMALAALRSVEHRKWLVRSTNTGVSVFVDANGRYVRHTHLDDPEILIEDVPMMPGRTVYSYIGDILGWLATAWTALLAVFVIRRRRIGALPPANTGLQHLTFLLK